MTTGLKPETLVTAQEVPDRDVVSRAASVVFEVSAEGDILASSHGAEHLVPADMRPLKGRSVLVLSNMFLGFDWADVIGRLNGMDLVQLEVWLNQGNGTSSPYTLSATPILSDGGKSRYLVWATPRSAIGSEKLHLIKSAYQDALTGLHNRRYLETHFLDCAETAIKTGERMALVVVDLNDFKSINDTFGHTLGDIVLESIAQALERSVPLGETIVRYGGDEFVILLQDVETQEDLADVLTEIRSETAKPVQGLEGNLKVSVSLGHSFFPDDGHSLRELVQKADQEMYRDKAASKGKAEPAPAATRSIWQKRLEATTLHHNLLPHYQPIVYAQTGQLRGYEALCRWRNEDGTLSYPNDFIPVAENFDLIARVDRIMFRKVATEVAEHPRFRDAGVEISVNLSAATLSTHGAADYYLRTLRTMNLPCRRFCIELTETTSLLDDGYGRDNLKAFADAECAIALDDFGTGFSSLSLLKDLPVSRIKIDRSFVSGVLTSSRDQDIVSGILSFCDAMGVQAIVEGVENAAQFQILRDLGARYCQGYFFGPPGP